MTPQLRIRAATGDDAEILSALEDAAFGDDGWGEGAVADGLTAPRVSGLIAIDPSPVGFALWRDIGTEAEILTIGVLPAARNKGVGRMLLAATEAAARRAGAGAMFLEVATDNDAALRLYEAAGYAVVGRRRNYYSDGRHAHVMRRAL